MVVNQAFVDRFRSAPQPLADVYGIALGRRAETTLTPRTVVGVAGTSVYASLRESPEPIIYVPLAQYDYPLAQPVHRGERPNGTPRSGRSRHGPHRSVDGDGTAGTGHHTSTRESGPRLVPSVAALLFGVAPGDPGTVIIAALTLLAVAGIAALAPALRASQIAPVDVLRAS